jgi:hypothetical protein
MPLRRSETLPPVMVSSNGIAIATRSDSHQPKNRARIFARCCEEAAPLAVTSTLSSIRRRPILQLILSLELLLLPPPHKLSPRGILTLREELWQILSVDNGQYRIFKEAFKSPIHEKEAFSTDRHNESLLSRLRKYLVEGSPGIFANKGGGNYRTHSITRSRYNTGSRTYLNLPR